MGIWRDEDSETPPSALHAPDELIDPERPASVSAERAAEELPGPHERHDPYAVLRYPDFRLFTLGRNIAVIGEQMVSVAVGWELYERTGQAMALGWVGLVQALPVILLALPAGHTADRFDRKRIILIGQIFLAMTSLGLLALSRWKGPIPLYYLCLLGATIVRAYSSPARAALLPQLVPEEIFSNAVTWNSSAFQLSAMLGPALGGLLIAVQKGAWSVYGADAFLEIGFMALTAMVSTRYGDRRISGPATLKTLAAGLQFVRDTRIILATITLDLFAVLLGGAVTLLPVYARDILHVGASGLGWMRAAPSAGALLMALTLAHLPPMKKAGQAMLWAVAGFGGATIVFGLSHLFWLSLLMLFLTGALDNISVVVRHTLVQILTPDEMRGRVSAVNNVFISSSNDLGGFESGAVAQALGPVISVVSGGIGTILVVLIVAALWPEVRRFGSLSHSAAP